MVSLYISELTYSGAGLTAKQKKLSVQIIFHNVITMKLYEIFMVTNHKEIEWNQQKVPGPTEKVQPWALS